MPPNALQQAVLLFEGAEVHERVEKQADPVEFPAEVEAQNILADELQLVVAQPDRIALAARDREHLCVVIHADDTMARLRNRDGRAPCPNRELQYALALLLRKLSEKE